MLTINDVIALIPDARVSRSEAVYALDCLADDMADDDGEWTRSDMEIIVKEHLYEAFRDRAANVYEQWDRDCQDE